MEERFFRYQIYRLLSGVLLLCAHIIRLRSGDGEKELGAERGRERGRKGREETLRARSKTGETVKRSLELGPYA